MYNLLVGISANEYPFSDIPTDKWYGHTIALYSTVKCNGVPIYHFTRYMCECALKNKTKNSICKNGYSLAHIPTKYQ
jgi:hypothetical protein